VQDKKVLSEGKFRMGLIFLLTNHVYVHRHIHANTH
jgi:hypothetical protein